jgi:hypothetical protein
MIPVLLALLSARAAEEPLSWRQLWLKLPETVNACGTFDYHPRGGMRVFYCHLLSQLSYASLQQRSPHAIFLSGPHTPAALKLDDPRSFGHYNPEFVRWLGEEVVPAAADPAFRERTQGIYDAYVAPLARVHYLTWRKLNAPASAACTQREKARYVRYMESGEGAGWGAYYERWFFYMNPQFCDKADDQEWFYDNGFDGGVSGNVVKTTVGFWLRRSLDGTDDEFHAALIRLLETYDADWLSVQSRL